MNGIVCGRGSNEIGEILESLDVEAYLDYEGVTYRHRYGSSGPQLNLKDCPACGHSDWKVYIGVDAKLGNCFHGSCELQTFNLWKYIHARCGGSNADTVNHIKQVASQLGWRPKRTAKAVTMEVPEVKLPAHIPLPDANGNILAYLTKRGVTPELCRYFHFSYCHEGRFWYKRYGKKVAQEYNGRILIPVFDLDGQLATFQGRDITGTKLEDKYLFPPGLPASGKFIYNGHNCWHAEHLVLGEGAFDALSIRAAFDDDPELRDVGAGATFGMHLSAVGTNDQLAQLVRLKQEGKLQWVTIMWDGEPKAIKRAVDATKPLRSVGIKARIALLPPDKDPNDLTAEEVRQAFYKAIDPTSSGGFQMLMRRMMLPSGV